MPSIPYCVKEIIGFPNYLIDTKGNVFSDKHNGRKKLKYKYNFEYPAVVLYKNKKPISKFIHRLLGENFIPNTSNKPFICHLNDIRTDNRLENLQWGTRGENLMDSYRNGRSIVKGEKCTFVKLTKKQVKQIRRFYKKNYFQKELAKKFKVSIGSISLIVNRKTWTHC